MMEAFYRENYPIVYGYLLALCGDPALAEELTAADAAQILTIVYDTTGISPDKVSIINR